MREQKSRLSNPGEIARISRTDTSLAPVCPSCNEPHELARCGRELPGWGCRACGHPHSPAAELDRVRSNAGKATELLIGPAKLFPSGLRPVEGPAVVQGFLDGDAGKYRVDYADPAVVAMTRDSWMLIVNFQSPPALWAMLMGPRPLRDDEGLSRSAVFPCPKPTGWLFLTRTFLREALTESVRFGRLSGGFAKVAASLAVYELALENRDSLICSLRILRRLSNGVPEALVECELTARQLTELLRPRLERILVKAIEKGNHGRANELAGLFEEFQQGGWLDPQRTAQVFRRFGKEE